MMKANAIFGIKATENWKGKVFNSNTQECYDGINYTNINACFRAYNSIQESVADYFNLICTSSRYRKALTTNTPKECIQAIKDGGYATDPNYVNKIMNIITSYNLTKFDDIQNKKTYDYVVGKNYELQVNLFVRTNAGTEYSIKSYDELTEDGKKHAVIQESGKNAVLKKGTIVTCLGIYIDTKGNTWLKIPSGFVAGFYNGEIYIK